MIVELIVAVPFDLNVFDLMDAHQPPQLLPQVFVFHRLVFAVFPTVFKPAANPTLLKTVHHIGGIAVNFGPARLLPVD